MLDYGRTATTTMTSYTKAKRSHSMPSRYVMPREELGEYDTGEPERRRSAPARPSSGMLFPLSEEGGLFFEKASNTFLLLVENDERLRHQIHQTQ